MSRLASRVLVVALFVAACRASAPAASVAPPEPVRPLAGLAAVPVVLAPTYTVRAGDALGWSARLASREFLRGLDAEIQFVLRERGLDSVWKLPDRLIADYRRNPTLGANPANLAAEPLRSPSLKPGQRVGEPLATQLRALVALHEGRHVLLPLEVRFEPAGAPASGQPASGNAVLRLVLIDARMAEVRWIGEVRSEPTTSPSKAVEASLGLRVGDLVAAP